jgi:hypothetical protein
LQQAPVSAPAVPSGCIILWSGSSGSIPASYYLCDGNNGTPDLRNRFVVGAGDTFSVNQTGGSADAIVVTHTHTATSVVTDPGHLHTQTEYNQPGIGNAGGGGARVNSLTANTGSATTGITVATTNANAGTSGTNANLPPYFALCYIMKS